MEIRVKVNSTYNNTIVTALHKDRILKTVSTGSIGFKKAKRASTLAAQAAGESLGYWLLLLDKALSQTVRTPNLGGTKNRISQGEGTSVPAPLGTPLSVSLGDAPEGTSSHRIGESGSVNTLASQRPPKGGGRLSPYSMPSLHPSVASRSKQPQGGEARARLPYGLASEPKVKEDLELKELANPKLKIPNSKLVASGGNLSAASQAPRNGVNKGSRISSGATKLKESNLTTRRPSGSLAGSLTCIKPLSVMVSGVGHGKFGAIKGLAKMGIKIKRISEITAIPHNGCKPPKMRRK